jgi:hypothetical protein
VFLSPCAYKLKNLLEYLVGSSLPAERRYVFVIDLAKALRGAIERMFGERCGGAAQSAAQAPQRFINYS